MDACTETFATVSSSWCR